MTIPKETMDALRSSLPRGAQKIIAERLNFSEEYVSRVLNGQVNQTINNMEIIQEAQKIIRQVREQNDELNKTLNP